MNLFVVQPIVEGHGEIAAVEVLLGRLVGALGIWGTVRTPRRLPKDQMVADEDELKGMLNQVRYDRAISLVLFLYDADDNCARDHVPQMRQWIAEAQMNFPCCVVMIRREFEAWFLATLPSLQGQALEDGESIAEDASYTLDPEAKRDAKSAVGQFILPKRKYTETFHQWQLSRHFDLGMAYANTATFRRLVQCLIEGARTQGQVPILPDDWERST